MDPNLWAEFAQNYDEKIYSVTRFSKNRDYLLERVPHGRILNLGTGPTPYLNQDLLSRGDKVVASDYCAGMLAEAQRLFTADGLNFVLSDARQETPWKGIFDGVVSINVILPETQDQVAKMLNYVYESLNVGGTFVGLFMSFEYINMLNNTPDFPADEELDFENLRVHDTTGWQCAQSKQSLSEHLEKAKFFNFNIETIHYDSPEELESFLSLYKVSLEKYPCEQHVAVARK
ncbi:class I SAM-dependent methyltransferase [Candidatus Woesearchaeota archaeon]|nr:class I SAM-dependent methyltransferase [Candidatus Woesearchaeota archaeon]